MAKEHSLSVDNKTLPLDLGGEQGGREPTAREVNKRIREENKALKSQSKASSRSAGAGLSVLARVQKKHPGNPKAQIAMFFGEFVIKSGTGRQRPVSERTCSGYSDGLSGMIDDLRMDRAAIKNLGELGKTHALRLIKYWMAQNQGGATIQNKISILRRFLTFIGKENAVPTRYELKAWLNQNGVEAPNWRQTVATKSLAWDDNNVDSQEVIARLRENCELTAMQLEVQAAFGLRMMESLQLDPRGADYGDYLRVVHGTKGGLPRDVPFDDDQAIREWQRDVIERAKLYAAQNRKGVLARPGCTLKVNRRYFYYQLEKAGITQKGLGVTAHGLRHQYAARRYTQISGLGAPVSKHGPLNVTAEVRQADLDARRQVSHALGHFRDDVTKAYIGSLPLMEKARTQRVKEWVQRTEENVRYQELLSEAGIVGSWLAGKFAQGLEVDKTEALRLIVRTHDGRPLNDNRLYALTQGLLAIYERGIDLSQHFSDSPPNDSVEIFIRK